MEGSSSLHFPAGSTLFIDRENSELRLLGADDSVQLVISITEQGIIVNLKAFQLNIQAADQLNLSGKRIHIDASEHLALTTAGSLEQRVAKDFTSEVLGDQHSTARIQRITADLGNVEIKANDDVRLNGERVKLNCD